MRGVVGASLAVFLITGCSLVLGDLDHFSQGSSGTDGGLGTDGGAECSELGLTSFFRFDEGQGKSASDCVTGAAAGIQGNVMWGPGHRASSLKLDGMSTCADFGTGHWGFTSAPFTVSAWVNVTSFPFGNGVDYLVGKRQTSGAQGWRLALVGNSFAFKISSATGEPEVASGSMQSSTGKWVHVAATYTPGAEMALFVNGSVESTLTTNVPTAIADSPSTSARLGCSSDSQSYFRGSLDDVRVYSRALTAQEIAALAQR